MKKISFLLGILTVVLAFSSCNKTETYADQLDRENEAINAYIVKHGIKVSVKSNSRSKGILQMYQRTNMFYLLALAFICK